MIRAFRKKIKYRVICPFCRTILPCLIVAAVLFTAASCRKDDGQLSQTVQPSQTAVCDDHTPQPTANLEQDSQAAMRGYGLLPESITDQADLSRKVTRAEFADLLVRSWLWDGPESVRPSYADVLPDHPYYQAIEQTKTLFDKLTSTAEQDTGASFPNFHPEEPLTRDEALKIISIILDCESTGQTLTDLIKLPTDDPMITNGNQQLLWSDASKLFYLVIQSQLPDTESVFEVQGIK